MSQIETIFRKVRERELELGHDGVLHLGGQVDVDVGDCGLHLLGVQPVGLDVLLHVVTLDKPSEKVKKSVKYNFWLWQELKECQSLSICHGCFKVSLFINMLIREHAHSETMLIRKFAHH